MKNSAVGLNVFKRKFYDSNLCILWKVEIYAAATTNQNQNGHFAKSFFAVQWRIPFVTPPVEVSSRSREARIYGWRTIRPNLTGFTFFLIFFKLYQENVR